MLGTGDSSRHGFCPQEAQASELVTSWFKTERLSRRAVGEDRELYCWGRCADTWLCCFLLLLLFSPSPGVITRLECLVKELALKWPVNPCSIKIDSLYSLGSGQLLKVSLGDGADMQCVVVSGPMLEGGGWRGGKVRTLQRQAFLQGNLIFSGNSLPFLLTNRFQISCPFSWLLHELKSWWKEFIPPFLKPKCS